MKLLKINSSVYDYGASAFEGCALSVEEVVRQLPLKDEDGSFDEYEFNTEIVEFSVELSDTDVRLINGLIDTHFDKFFKIK